MILKMKEMFPLLSICHLASCFSASISLRTSRHQHLKKNRCRRYVLSALRNFLYSSCPVEAPSSFAGAGNSLGGRPAASSSQSKGKGKATADTGAKKAAEGATWGSGQGRSLGSRPTNGVGAARTLGGAGLVGVGGASIPRPPLRSGRKPPARERSPTPDYGVDDDDDDVIVIDSDVD
jgi:hypothetical protein